MATTYYQDIQKLYVAYFNRPADPAGLAYWEGIVEAAKGSTVAVSAAFAAEAEYKTEYAGMSNADIVAKVYLNLFGRAAETAGKAYWADLLDKKVFTIDKVVTQIAAGAQGSDLAAYNNKVTAAQTFTAAVDTQAEIAGYAGVDANKAAKVFMSGITDDASLTNAIKAAMLNATVAKVVAAGTPFTLTSGLAAVQTANAAHAAFLDAADGKADGKTTLTDAAIGADVGTKAIAVGALVDVTYASASPGVKAALLADKIAANNTALTTANKAVADANVSIAKVAGLAAAISTADATIAARAAADKALLNANADLAAKVAAYGTLNGGTAVTVNTDGTVAGLITKDTNGNLKLVTSITETTNAGVTALLNASSAKLAAVVADNAAITVQASASATVDYLDMGATEKTDLQAVGAAMKNVTLATGALPTLGDITAEKAILGAKSSAATKADADYALANAGAHDATLQANATSAAAAVTTFNGLVTTYNGHAPANALVDALTTANLQVKSASDTITALSTAVDAMNKSVDLKAQLDAVNGQVSAANQSFLDNKLALPVTLDVPASLIATAGSDIYVSGKADATIALFGLQGSDSLYIGTGFTLASDITKGNDAVLEAFIVKSGTDTKIVLEQKAFASNELAPEVVTITLTGVDSTHVHLSNGIITYS